jgi:hypothetical protein
MLLRVDHKEGSREMELSTAPAVPALVRLIIFSTARIFNSHLLPILGSITLDYKINRGDNNLRL